MIAAAFPNQVSFRPYNEFLYEIVVWPENAQHFSIMRVCLNELFRYSSKQNI